MILMSLKFHLPPLCWLSQLCYPHRRPYMIHSGILCPELSSRPLSVPPSSPLTLNFFLREHSAFSMFCTRTMHHCIEPLTHLTIQRLIGDLMVPIDDVSLARFLKIDFLPLPKLNTVRYMTILKLKFSWNQFALIPRTLLRPKPYGRTSIPIIRK